MSKDPAAARFFILQAVRLGGVLMTVYALLVLSNAAPWPDGVPREAAYILLLIGLIEAFLMPQVLVRRWSSRNR